MIRVLVTILVASALLAAGALQSAFAAAPAETKQTKIGPVLSNDGGLTLYTFDKDADGQSACNGPCTEKWPPQQAHEGDQPEGDYTIIKRADGSMQWAYKGKPLYMWINDETPDDTKGDGLNEVWHAARP
jgi:predicted lipoprotein with Yx(FWY)xxD motif